MRIGVGKYVEEGAPPFKGVFPFLHTFILFSPKLFDLGIVTGLTAAA